MFCPRGVNVLSVKQVDLRFCPYGVMVLSINDFQLKVLSGSSYGFVSIYL